MKKILKKFWFFKWITTTGLFLVYFQSFHFSSFDEKFLEKIADFSSIRTRSLFVYFQSFHFSSFEQKNLNKIVDFCSIRTGIAAVECEYADTTLPPPRPRPNMSRTFCNKNRSSLGQLSGSRKMPLKCFFKFNVFAILSRHLKVWVQLFSMTGLFILHEYCTSNFCGQILFHILYYLDANIFSKAKGNSYLFIRYFCFCSFDQRRGRITEQQWQI